MSLIYNFIFPSFTIRTSFLIHKIIIQNLIFWCRALLLLQLILHTNAQRLDQRLIHRVHKILDFLFCPLSKLLTLLLELEDFDFLSILKINAGIVVDSLVWDLKYHIPAYWLMANIMLADWTCHINSCIYQLDGHRLDQSFLHFLDPVLARWLIATDRSAKFAIQLDNPLTGHIVRSLHAISFTQLKDLGT